MAYIDFLTYQYVFNPHNLPNDWPAHTKSSANQNDELEENWQRLSLVDFNLYISDTDRVDRLNAAQEFFANSKILKITSILDDRFTDLPPNKIDFRRHLQDGMNLSKTITMSENGRPVKAEYKNGEELIARISFEFQTNSFNLITRRIERLGYFNLNGDISNEYVISDEVWDLSQTYYLAKAINERYLARSIIFDEVKAYINALMLQEHLSTGKTYQDVLSDGYLFWKAYSSDIDAWFHIGADGPLGTRILNDTEFEFLDIEVAPGITIRSWIISRISY